MVKMRKVTRSDINKNNMVTLGYCQCQRVLDMFAYDYKIGYNTGIYGWNYDLYRINDVDVVTGYNVPFKNYSNKGIEKQLVALENKVRKNKDYTLYDAYKKEFFDIFE